MHAIHRPKFIIKTAEHFFPHYPIHKHSAKFYFIKFEGKVYEMCFLFPNSKQYNLKSPVKKSQQAALGGGFSVWR